MRRRLVGFLAALAACTPPLVEPDVLADPAPDDELLGGAAATVRDDGVNAFAYPARVLTRTERRAFAVGNAFFKDNWVIAPSSTAGRDGLGPLFNARSCSSCHFKDGRGRPPEGDEAAGPSGLLLRIGVDAGAHPAYGGQLQDQAIPGSAPEVRIRIRRTLVPGRYADGEPYELERPRYELAAPAYGAVGEAVRLSPRVAPQIIGMGLLEAVPEETILARADPDDRDGDGISGRANYVWDERRQRKTLGRFGWKANQPTVEQQVAAAFLFDIGITSSLFPSEPHTAAQRLDYVSGGEPELDDHKLQRITFYCRTLAVPARRDIEDARARRGQYLFHAIGCNACHVPTLTAGIAYEPLPAFAGTTFRPYTDLLLHDMGPDLADDKPDGLATGTEWRTPPLWGIGLFATVNGHTRYLHDGRARNLAEAILWHGGEAERAREAFRRLSAADRAALIAFLKSL